MPRFDTLIFDYTLADSSRSIIGGYLYQEHAKGTPFVFGSGLLLLGAVEFLLVVREPRSRET